MQMYELIENIIMCFVSFQCQYVYRKVRVRNRKNKIYTLKFAPYNRTVLLSIFFSFLTNSLQSCQQIFLINCHNYFSLVPKNLYETLFSYLNLHQKGGVGGKTRSSGRAKRVLPAENPTNRHTTYSAQLFETRQLG